MSNRQIDNIDTGKPALPAKRKRGVSTLNRLSKISVFTATLALLSLSHASYAEDQKTYPGSDCQSVPGQIDDPDREEVTCPIVRDNIANTNGTKEAWVRISNGEPGVQCTLQSRGAGGGPLIASKTASTTATGFQVLNVDVNASAPYGFYDLFCNLPCLAGDAFCLAQVISYRINEY